MTEFLKRSTASGALWWPVLLKGFLWVSIASGTAFMAELKDMTPEVLAKMTSVDWAESALSTIIAGLTALRLFIDQSVSSHANKLKTQNGTTNLTTANP